MKKNDILVWFTKQKKYQEACRNICKNNILWEDLYQELFIKLSEYKEDKIEDAFKNGYFDFFVVRIIQSINNQRCRSNSPLKTICSDDVVEEVMEENYNHEIDKAYQKLNKEIENEELYGWYDIKLFELYLEHRSYRKLSAKTGIPYNSIQVTIQNQKKKIKKNVKIKIEDFNSQG